MHKKHILILGAGLMQRPAFEAARNLGCCITAVDANSAALCVSMADFFEPVDLKDKEAIRALALRLKSQGRLDGIFTAGTDFSASVSYAAEACGLPSHAYTAAVNASDKSCMRQCFARAGIPSPRFTEYIPAAGKNVWSVVSESGLTVFPVVVKPVDNMGGRGCRLVSAGEELEAAVIDAAANSRSGRVIIEEYMDGAEFSIDALVYDGSVTVCGFADRHIFFPPYFIETGHTLPSAASGEIRRQLFETFVRGIHALGLTCGAAKADIKMTSRGPMIGEIAARLSGGYMSGWTYPYASGFPLTEQAECIALGIPPEKLLSLRIPVETGCSGSLPLSLYEIPAVRTSAERAWISIPGIVAEVNDTGIESRVPGIKDILPRSKKGDAVIFPHNNVEKCGNVITSAGNRNQAVNAAETAVGNITLRLQPCVPETDVFLNEFGSGCRFPPDAYALPAETAAVFDRYCRESTGSVPLPFTAASVIPACLLPVLDTVTDWNHRTLRQTIELYDADSETRYAAGVQAEIPLDKFWKSCIRGGIQGMWYVVDSIVYRQNHRLCGV